MDAAGGARARAGDPAGAADRPALRAAGLLRTPEDLDPPPVVARAAALQREWQAASRPAWRGCCAIRALLEAHTAMLPPPRRPRVDPIDPTLVLARARIEEAESLDAAIGSLSPQELAAALADAVALRRLSALA